MLILKAPVVAAIVKAVPAVHVRTLFVMAQLIWPVTPVAPARPGGPIVMLVDGRVSVRITAPLWKLASAFPVFATWIVQSQLLPSVAAPLTLSLLTAVRSGASTVTVSLHELLALVVSATTLPGSTMHVPPVGFT